MEMEAAGERCGAGYVACGGDFDVKWRRRDDSEEDLERELRSHFEAEISDQQEQGLSAEEARYAAHRAFGNPSLVREEIREMWSWGSIERLLQDMRFSVRTLRKGRASRSSPCSRWRWVWARTPLCSVLSMQFCCVRFLSGTPIRLVGVWEDASHFGFPLPPLAPANAANWKRRNHVFEDIAALKADLYALTGAGTPEQVQGSAVTANLFPLLGVSPILGRAFKPKRIKLAVRVWF